MRLFQQISSLVCLVTLLPGIASAESDFSRYLGPFTLSKGDPGVCGTAIVGNMDRDVISYALQQSQQHYALFEIATAYFEEVNHKGGSVVTTKIHENSIVSHEYYWDRNPSPYFRGPLITPPGHGIQWGNLISKKLKLTGDQLRINYENVGFSGESLSCLYQRDR
jgi:hypothetical protein